MERRRGNNTRGNKKRAAENTTTAQYQVREAGVIRSAVGRRGCALQQDQSQREGKRHQTARERKGEEKKSRRWRGEGMYAYGIESE